MMIDEWLQLQWPQRLRISVLQALRQPPACIT
jgi:hypothetical protein